MIIIESDLFLSPTIKQFRRVEFFLEEAQFFNGLFQLFIARLFVLQIGEIIRKIKTSEVSVSELCDLSVYLGCRARKPRIGNIGKIMFNVERITRCNHQLIFYGSERKLARYYGINCKTKLTGRVYGRHVHFPGNRKVGQGKRYLLYMRIDLQVQDFTLNNGCFTPVRFLLSGKGRIFRCFFLITGYSYNKHEGNKKMSALHTIFLFFSMVNGICSIDYEFYTSDLNTFAGLILVAFLTCNVRVSSEIPVTAIPDNANSHHEIVAL